MKNFFKSKKGTVLTEALISMVIVGTLFVSIATAVTASISNTRRLQEVNETSAYAQQIVDAFYALEESESDDFLSKVREQYQLYVEGGNYENDFLLSIGDIEASIGDTESKPTLYNILPDTDTSEYIVKIYLLPSLPAGYSVNYFITYAPALNGTGEGGIYNVSDLSNVYTFKLVVSKSVNEIETSTTNFTAGAPATVTYIFQLSSGKGE